MTKEPWHGTLTGYVVHKCRCEPCRSFYSIYSRERRALAASAPIRGDEQWHGTLAGYNYHGCRCQDCKASKSAHRRVAKMKLRSREVTGSEDWHGTVNGYTNRLCRCDACRAANRNRFQAATAEYRARNGEYLKVDSRVRMAEYRKLTNQFRENQRPWTSAEDALALDESMRVLDIAFNLGRTYASVAGRRNRLKKRNVAA